MARITAPGCRRPAAVCLLDERWSSRGTGISRGDQSGGGRARSCLAKGWRLRNAEAFLRRGAGIARNRSGARRLADRLADWRSGEGCRCWLAATSLGACHRRCRRPRGLRRLARLPPPQRRGLREPYRAPLGETVPAPTPGRPRPLGRLGARRSMARGWSSRLILRDAARSRWRTSAVVPDTRSGEARGAPVSSIPRSCTAGCYTSG